MMRTTQLIFVFAHDSYDGIKSFLIDLKTSKAPSPFVHHYPQCDQQHFVSDGILGGGAAGGVQRASRVSYPQYFPSTAVSSKLYSTGLCVCVYYFSFKTFAKQVSHVNCVQYSNAVFHTIITASSAQFSVFGMQCVVFVTLSRVKV